ncbi:MAG: hypothetical protein ACI4RT_09440 [Candidatus Spyradenecus sp.]
MIQSASSFGFDTKGLEYTLSSDTPATANTPRVVVFKGLRYALDKWLPEAKAYLDGKRFNLTLSVDGHLAIVTLTEAGATSGTNDPTAGDVRTPTLTLTSQPFDRPIETIEAPTNFAAITPARILELRAIAQSLDTAAYEALTDAAEQAYAKLLIQGITSRQEPAYTCQVTRYIPLDDTFAATLPAANTITTWENIVSFIGNAAASYTNPDENLKWLPIGSAISVKEQRYAEVSITYQGAYYFPEELYAANS